MINSNNKKEVSCKTLIPIFYAAKEKGIELNELIKGVPYDLAYLLNKHERIEWNNWCKIYSNSRSFFGPSEYEKMGRNYVIAGGYIVGVLASYFLFSSNKFSRKLVKHFFKMCENDFACVKTYIEYSSLNKIIIEGHLASEYEFSPEFFLIGKGVFEQFGKQIGHKEFKIDFNWITQGAVFVISWQKENIFSHIKKWIFWLFNIRKAFLDLTDSHEELLNQYIKLEESKRTLQKQTTQLRTAHDISKSIRQSRDINNTLYVIAEALIHDADFSFANIRLFKDIEGNKLDIIAVSGFEDKNTISISRPVIINNEKIGELIVHPKIGIDQFECEDMLTYLQPIINITIHDALVLRTVTDYKNNLEAKVETRTAELKKAQSKLSKTIHLLEEAQLTQNNFFTNISHEFRTPLTLILGPANQILEISKNEKVKEDAKLIHRSAKKLNRLANQLLDISRIEAGQMKLKTTKQNLVTVINKIVSSFQSFAERKNISLKLNSDEEELLLYLDKDKIDKIISNILSNALKFTPSGGSVGVTLSQPTPISPPVEGTFKISYVEISIWDTGIGIPKDQLNKIFDRFYQVDHKLSKQFEGTGVGLSLTKELVELHKGKILVESEEGKGSTFKILLPLGKDHLLPEEICKDEITKDDQNKYDIESIMQSKDDSFLSIKKISNKFDAEFSRIADAPTLLIVEDNPDVRKYIKDILDNYYNISEAVDGKEGLEKSIEQIPDLIISDIMMPKMDGIKLCKALRTDPRTSHIPIILLTAKATLQDKIEGFESGADSYIMKPFEADELKARIKNLIEQRNRLHKHFHEHGLFEIDKNKVTPVDQKFLQKAFVLINEHLSDSCFDIEKFADGMSVSRSLLHKKLSALIGEPPGELLKRVRLNKAAELIDHDSGNITEISFEVGFNNSSYFTECFKKQFGVSPSQYHHNNS